MRPRIVRAPRPTPTGGRITPRSSISSPAGTPIPTNDVWIAAATVDAGSHLLTFDSHYERVEGLDRTILAAAT